MTLRTLNYGNRGIYSLFWINAGIRSSTVRALQGVYKKKPTESLQVSAGVQGCLGALFGSITGATTGSKEDPGPSTDRAVGV